MLSDLVISHVYLKLVLIKHFGSICTLNPYRRADVGLHCYFKNVLGPMPGYILARLAEGLLLFKLILYGTFWAGGVHYNALLLVNTYFYVIVIMDPIINAFLLKRFILLPVHTIITIVPFLIYYVTVFAIGFCWFYELP